MKKTNVFFLQMNMTRKFHNHRLQIDPWLHDKGAQNTVSHTTLKRSDQLSFSARWLQYYKGHQEQNLKTMAQHKLPQPVGATTIQNSYSLSVIRKYRKWT